MEEAAPAERKFANSTPDWAVRVMFFVIFLFFAAGKFTNDPKAAWVVFFQKVGFGQWFRWFTGILEVVGAFLVLIPKTVHVGLVLLICVASGAMLVELVLLHRPTDAFVPFAVLTGMIAFWMHRRRV